MQDCWKKDLKNKILVIGGGSSEEIDDVRVITNKSTGKMATPCEAAFNMGADVELWMGETTEVVGEWIINKNSILLKGYLKIKKLISMTRY